MFGDFNCPDINWSNPDSNCLDAGPLILFSDRLFLNQQVPTPRIITAKTLFPISQFPPPCQTMNPTCNTFEPHDFKKTDWSGPCTSIKSVKWKALLHECIPSKYL